MTRGTDDISEFRWESTADFSIHVLHHRQRKVAIAAPSVRGRQYLLSLSEWCWTLVDDMGIGGEENNLSLAMSSAHDAYVRYIEEQEAWLPENVIHYQKIEKVEQ
jgi:hypothetical protein